MNHNRDEQSNGADVAISVVSLGILFCLLYSSFVFTISIVKASEESEITKPLEQFTKPAKKEVGNANKGLPLVPERIIAPSIDLDADIISPHSRDLAALDAALLEGVVHYPGSGYAGETANVFLFGHSSFLPVVYNQNFKVFNQIKELKVGDTVVIESNGEQFTYNVISNRLAKNHEVRVDFDTDRPMLTLATCNSFGSAEDRYVIEAVLVD